MPKRIVYYDTDLNNQRQIDPATTLAASAPASAALQTAGGAFGRWVYGHFTLLSTVANAATITVAMETAVGSGVFTNIQVATMPITLVGSIGIPFGFFCPTGRQYKFTKAALAGVTETIAVYSYTEF